MGRAYTMGRGRYAALATMKPWAAQVDVYWQLAGTCGRNWLVATPPNGQSLVYLTARYRLVADNETSTTAAAIRRRTTR